MTIFYVDDEDANLNPTLRPHQEILLKVEAEETMTESSARSKELQKAHSYCQCCLEPENSVIYKKDRKQLLRCKNKEASHNVCLECISSYMREWLRDNATSTAKHKINSNNWNNSKSVHQEICKIPCFCPSDKECDSHLIIDDWTSILPRDEVEVVRDVLAKGNQIEYIKISASTKSKTSKKDIKKSSSPSLLSSSKPRSKDPIQLSAIQRKLSLQRAQDYVRKVKIRITQRRCPNCDTILAKDPTSGCNKVVCNFCETYVCYSCEVIVAVDGYEHFSVDQYSKKCPLWTDEQVDYHQDQAIVKDEIFRMAQQLYRR